MIAQFGPYYNMDPIGKDADTQLIIANSVDVCNYYGFTTDDGELKSYWNSIIGLLCLFIFFRLMVIVSLVLQDVKWNLGETGDTRNTAGRSGGRAALGNGQNNRA